MGKNKTCHYMAGSSPFQLERKGERKKTKQLVSYVDISDWEITGLDIDLPIPCIVGRIKAGN